MRTWTCLGVIALGLAACEGSEGYCLDGYTKMSRPEGRGEVCCADGEVWNEEDLDCDPVADAAADAGVDAGIDDAGEIDAAERDAPLPADAEPLPDAPELDADVDGGACVVSAETCNGADDDCDGTVDEGTAAPSGAPVPLSSGGSGGSTVAVASVGDGFVAVWSGSDGRLRWQRVERDGTGSGSAALVTPEDASGLAQVTAAVQVLGTSLLVGWEQGSGIRARSVPLSGGAAPAAFEVAPTGRYPAIAILDGVPLVLWTDGSSILQRATDSAFTRALGVAGSPAVSLMGISDTPVEVVSIAATEPYLLAAFADRRAGDTEQNAYVATLGPLGTAMLRRIPHRVTTPRVAMSALDDPDGRVVVLVASRDAPDATAGVEAFIVQPGAAYTDTPTVVASHDLDTGVFKGYPAVSAADGYAHAAWAEISSTRFPVAWRSLTASGPVRDEARFGEVSPLGFRAVATATATPLSALVVFASATTDDPTAFDVYAQPIRCLP